MTTSYPSRLVHCITVTAGLLLGTAAIHANPGQPSFGPNVYGDGALWGTKGTTALPAPNAHNAQAYDGLYIITNGAEGQVPVSEAAPGNPMYNGGRWIAYTVSWNASGLAYYGGDVPLLTSFAALWLEFSDGHLDIVPGHANPDAPDYFQCPLLPNKQG